MRTNEPLSDFARYDARQSAELSRCPICACCDEPIQEEYYFETRWGIYCEECFDDKVLWQFKDDHKVFIED